ncbi:hypothetical protein D9615_008474 [Tricholomella constricta]|uniref:MADS-box domain-containing protein n=1 Tax=Tricholomella constricta TaxID=117010 RepID=A0A8H5H3U4_9AGAR|nr:hypothetical protein D9615_008474 [Tricholomella constricta]
MESTYIQHERNRSVTFLKRKNGLFKKAYELGVLCSIDVAVIIFEERPGHPRKLYQYCSSDINAIVQRQLRHDGERDTRGPDDFAPAAATAKAEDVEIDIGEDENGDDEVDGLVMPLIHGGSQRKGDWLAPDIEYLPRSQAYPQRFPLRPSSSLAQSQQRRSHRHHHTQVTQQYEQERHLPSMSSYHDHHDFPGQVKRPRLEVDSPVSSSSSAAQFRAAVHPASYGQSYAHAHGQIHQQQEQYTAYSNSAPSTHSTRSMSSGMHPPPRAMYGDMVAGSNRSTPGGGGSSEVFGHLSSRDDSQGRGALTLSSTGAGGHGIEWPLSSKSAIPHSNQHTVNPDPAQRHENERVVPVDRTSSGPAAAGALSTGGVGSGAGGADSGTTWLDYLSGTGKSASSTGPGTTATPPGGVSWERSGSSRGSAGGAGAPGGGEAVLIDGMALYGGEKKTSG